MPRRSINTQGKFLPKIPTILSSEPSLFFGDCQLTSLTTRELEDPQGGKRKFFKEHIRKEEESTSPTHTMVENRDNEVFPINGTNGEAIMNNISPTSLPHFHGLTS